MPPVAEDHQPWDLGRKNPPTAASINPFSDRIQMKPIGGMKFMQKVQSQSPPPQPTNEADSNTQPTNLDAPTKSNSHDSHKAQNRELQNQVAFLCEKVQQLSNELQTTRQSHILSSDQSRAEIKMLQSELNNQRTRHEEIVASLRKRLVESEMARNKIQEQMMMIVEEENKKEAAMTSKWNEIALKVNEDAKWVEEQMACWKESLEEHEKRMGAAKLRGELNAELPAGCVTNSSGVESGGAVVDNDASAAERRRQRRTFLGYDDEDFSDDD